MAGAVFNANVTNSKARLSIQSKLAIASKVAYICETQMLDGMCIMTCDSKGSIPECTVFHGETLHCTIVSTSRK